MERKSSSPLLSPAIRALRISEGNSSTNNKGRDRRKHFSVDFGTMSFGALKGMLSSPITGNKSSSTPISALKRKEKRKKKKRGEKREQLENVDFALQDFNRNKYIEDIFINNNWSRDDDRLLDELKEKKKKHTSRLQDLVTDNYEEFIFLSKQIAQFMDQDIAEIAGMISEMRNTVSVMQKLDFSQGASGSIWSDARSLELMDANNKENIEDELLDFEAAVETRDFESMILLSQSIRDKIETYNSESEEMLLNFEERRSELVCRSRSLLIPELRSNRTRTAKRKYISYIQQLEGSDIARQEYLQACSYDIQRGLFRVTVTGDAIQYTNESSNFLFEHILTSMSEFMHLFNARTDMAAFVIWALDELTTYCEQFKLHVFTESQSLETVVQCIKSLFFYCTEAERNGITVDFHVERLIQEDLRQAVMNRMGEIETALAEELAVETWRGNECRNELCDLFEDERIRGPITIGDSAVALSRLTWQFMKSIRQLPRFQFFQETVNKLVEIIEHYLTNLYRLICSEYLSDEQFMTAISNMWLTRDLLVPKLKEALLPRCNRRIPEMDKLLNNLDILDVRVVETFCRLRADVIVNDKIGWGLDKRYPAPQTSETAENDQPEFKATSGMRSSFSYASSLTHIIRRILPRSYIRFIVERLFDAMSDCMNSRTSALWTRIELSLKGLKHEENEETHVDGTVDEQEKLNSFPDITISDLNQIIVDVSFFRFCVEESGLLTDTCHTNCDAIIADIGKLVKDSPRDIPKDELFTAENIDTFLRGLTLQDRLEEHLEQLKTSSRPIDELDWSTDGITLQKQEC